MNTTDRPPSAIADQDPQPVETFVAGLQEALVAADADMFNRQFAADVLWGTPFGAVVEGYDTIHSIHLNMIGDDHGASRSTYSIEHTRRIGTDVAIAYVRRTSDAPKPTNETPGRADAFDELTLFVLVHRDGQWWLAAAQHVPDRTDVYRTNPPPGWNPPGGPSPTTR